MKYGDLEGGNVYSRSVGVMGSVGVWDGWSFGAEYGFFGVGSGGRHVSRDRRCPWF